MAAKTFNNSTQRTPRCLKVVGIIGVLCALIVVLAALIAYLPEHLDFSLFITYLSDVRVTPTWPQIGWFPIPTP
jgi:hypothetical protein